MRTKATRNRNEQQLLDNIQHHGWQGSTVGAAETAPTFTYSIGLWDNLKFPELIVVGYPGRYPHSMLSIAAERARRGDPIALDQPCGDFFSGLDCVLVRVPEARYGDFVPSALWYSTVRHSRCTRSCGRPKTATSLGIQTRMSNSAPCSRYSVIATAPTLRRRLEQPSSS